MCQVNYRPREDCQGLLSVAQRTLPQMMCKRAPRISDIWNVEFDLRARIGGHEHLVDPYGGAWVPYGDSSMTF
jgi:hypothetical protein